MKRSAFTTIVKQTGDISPETDHVPNDHTVSLSDRMLFPSMVALSRSALPDGHHFSSPGPSSANHVCRVCAKVFRASSLLDIHMRVHVGAKPFVCPVCGHRATQKGNLKLHMKKHHGAELPPHIDLVPDSGIWGHPQKIFPFCSYAGSSTEGIDSNNNNNDGDTTGKCKQVAQAVSSLLDEEVVELIKKYQDDSGQGAAGTITESLEDFIRIAKNKAASDAKLASGGLMPVAAGEKYVQRSKERVTSLQSQSHAVGNGAFLSESTSEMSDPARCCALCGRSLNKLHLAGFGGTPKLPLCDDCVSVRGYVQLLPRHVSSRAKGLKNREKTISAVSIANVSSDEGVNTTDASSDRCSVRFTVMEDLASLVNRKNRCRSEKTTSIDPKKERFLPGVGVIAESNASRENDESSVANTIGLVPVISHLKLPDSKARSKSYPDVTKMESKVATHLKPTSKEETVRKRPRSCDLELESRPKRTRASPDVLNLLRRTLLHSTDQKMASAQWQNTDSRGTAAAAAEDATRDQRLVEVFSYRNPAMQSLAQIGKWDLSSENDSVASNTHSRNMGILKQEVRDVENSGYRCQYCQKWFKYRSVLEIHLRSHTGERPFKCPYCEYAGTQLNCLKLHFQRHHPAEYAASAGKSAAVLRQNQDSTTRKVPSCVSPVNCPLCGRASPSPGYLKIHMRSHKKSLDHVCHICGRGFKQYWYLSTHLKSHERELNALKRNVDPCKEYLTAPKSPHLIPNSPVSKLPDGIFNPDEKSRIKQYDHPDMQPIFQNYGNQCRLLVKNIQNQQRPLVKSDCYVEPRHKIVDHVSLSVPRSRRRKAACPSRVVTNPSAPKSPVWCHARVVNGAAPAEELWKSQRGKTENVDDEMPLDLRCEAKKMSDMDKNDDVPMDLCKL